MTDDAERARETPNVHVGLVVAGMISALVLVVVAVVGLYGFYHARAPNASFVPPRTFPAPQLQTGDDGILDPSIARQRAKLKAYAWVDRGRGVVQVPIDRAMALVAARGDKAYDPIPAPSQKAQP